MSAGAIPVSNRPAGTPFTGRKLGDIFFDEFFEYISTITFDVANGNKQVSIQVQADAHFIWVTGLMNCNQASGSGTFQGAGVNRGGSLVQITDGATQRQLSSAQVPASTLFGSAQRPFVLPLRKLFRANSAIQISATDTTGGTSNVTDYVFAGFKVPLGSVPGML